MKTLLSILLTLITTIGINAQNWDVRFKQTSVNCQTKQVCYDVQFKINGNGPFVLAGQNYRIYYDASKMSFTAGSSYLPSPVYTDLVLVQNAQVDADYINGSLPFESTLGFLNFYIDLNDYVNGGIPLSTTDWVSTASLCFDVDDDLFSNNGNCLEMVFAREGYTDEYASAFMQASRWVAPNQTTGADGVDYYDLTSTNGSEACLASLCADTSSYNIRLKLDTVNCETNEFCYNVQLQSSGGNDVHLAGQNYRIYWDAEVASFMSGMSVLPVPMYTSYTQVQLLENQNASGYGLLPFEDHLSFINYTMDLTDLNSGGIVLPAGVWTTTSKLCFTGTQELFDNPNVCMDVVFARPGLTDGYATAFMEVAEWMSPTKLIKLNPNLYFDMNSQTMGSEACLDNVCIDTSTYDVRLTLDTVNCDTKEFCYDVQLRSSGGNNAHLAGQNYRIYWDAEVASFMSGMSVLPVPMYTSYTQVQLLENQNASGYGLLPFEDHLSFINYTMDLTDLNSGGIVLPAGVWTTTSKLCFTGTQELFDNPNVCMDVVFARPGLTDGYATAFMEVAEWKNPTKLIKMNPDTYFDMNSQTMGSEACITPYCPCDIPILTVGDVECSGTEYSVLVVHNGQNITSSAGVISGNYINNIPLGTSVTITSSNRAGCESTIIVNGPSICLNTCGFPKLIVGQGKCSSNGFYEISFTESTGAVLSVNAGTISGNSVINIPIGTNLIITASNGNCVLSYEVVSPSDCDNICGQPHISVSRTECEYGNLSYSINFIQTSGATLTSSHGTVSAGVVSGIPAGQAVTLTVSFAGCPDQVLVVPAPVCGCERPVLTTGDITCEGNSYSVIFFHNGSSISASAGTVSGNRVIDIPLGTNVTITSSNEADCNSTITVTGPTVCQTTCNYPTLNVGQGVCSGNNTYSVSFTESTGAVISVNAGTISGNSVINIPLGTNVELTAANGACVVKITVISPQSCGDICDQPHVSVSRTECSADNASYSVYYTLVSGATLTSSHGTVSAGVVSGIP
ncbi:MAG TPA: hypothetical protein PLM26_12530, partial [Saprospiraceae bacterium]|nr:hypothetical protein [Saprospiraceae bacterium]